MIKEELRILMDFIEHGWRRRRRKKERVFYLLWAGRDRKRRVFIDGHLSVGEKWPVTMVIDDSVLQEKFLEGEKTSISLSHSLSFHSWALLYYNYNYYYYRKQ